MIKYEIFSFEFLFMKDSLFVTFLEKQYSLEILKIERVRINLFL